MPASLLAIFNVAAAILVTAFFLALNQIAPDPYLGYSSDNASAIMTLFANSAFAIPFIVTAWLQWARRKGPRDPRRITAWHWIHFAALAAIATYLLRFLWIDQFQASRGFGLIAVGALYSVIFVPLWSAGFFFAKRTPPKDGNQAEP